MIRLLIDGRVCDADLSQVKMPDYHFDELSKVESRREGDHIRLELPSTPENDIIFCNATDLQSAERFNDEFHAAVIEVDGVELFRGTAYFDGVEMSDKGVFYRIEIIGGAAQWARQACRLMFNQIEMDYTSLLDMVEIGDSWTNSSPIKFLPVQRSREELSNGQTVLTVPEKILTTEDYHPFISVDALVRAIFSEAGYSIDSRFFESELFRSLYISGAYPTTDLDAKAQKMDFLAGRTKSVATTANFRGRVFATPAVVANSVGNIVEVVASDTVDADGNVVSSGFFSENNCFTLDDEGFIIFKPLTKVNVGFEYLLKFACGYQIESRGGLKSFNHVYLGDGVTVPFQLTNRFKDYREELHPDFEYRFVNFDYSSEYKYKLQYQMSGRWYAWADVNSKTVLVVTPEDISTADRVALFRAAAASEQYELCAEDWALYEGWIDYEGVTEAELVVRTPAVELSANSKKYFDSIYFGGAVQGMSFTLLSGTTIRPIFTSSVGYGSRLTFEDVAHIRVRQSVLLDAVQQMFNLRFYTDERCKRVYIEPYDDFMQSAEQYDWSDRIDYSKPITIEDIVRNIHEKRTIGYGDGDKSVRQYNTENNALFGEWSYITSSRAAIQGEEDSRNPLFAPTISLSGGFINAESALVMQMDGEEESGADESVRVVKYVGMHPLAEGERWGYPYSEAEYPLAAFHFAGDECLDGFTLCFENRDGSKGLHSFYDQQFAEDAECRKVTLSMRILPDEFVNLFHFVDGQPSIRSIFVLKINGLPQCYRLHSVEEYDALKQTARCSFVQMNPYYV